jgi:membrane protease YdiL (CAAX protease family)
MESVENRKKIIIRERFRFVAEVLLIFIGIFLFLLIPRVLFPIFVDEKNVLFGPIYYLLRALAILIAIPVFLFISNIVFESQKRNIILEEDLTPASAHIKLYSISKENFRDQLLYGILILFIVFIPLDFLGYYLFPATLEYTAVALSSQSTDSYLLANYSIFLFSVLVIQISVAVYEESLTRGFLTGRGCEYFHKISAVIIPSLYFGLMHFAYFLNPVSRNYPIWIPFIWFLQTFFVAILLSIFIIRKKKIFPLIFAHALNNIISAHAVWNYLQGNDFMVVTMNLYLPLLIVSGILFIWQFPRIKNSISDELSEIKTYFKANIKKGESKGDIYFRILFDIVIGFIILLFGLLFAV